MMSCPVFSMLLGILSSTISACCPAQLLGILSSTISACCLCVQHVARYFVLHNFSMMSCPVFSMLLGILSSTISACCPAQCSACCSVFCPPQFQHAVLPSFSMLLGIVLNNFSMLPSFQHVAILSSAQFQNAVQPSVQHVARYFVLHNFSMMSSPVFSMLSILSSTISECCPAQCSACCSLFCPPQFQHVLSVQHVARYFVLHNFSMLSSPVFSMLLGILSSTISECCPA